MAARARPLRKTAERGYGGSHQKLHKHWAPIVAAGGGWCTEPICLMTTRWIPPGTPWHLAHAEGQAGYRGPAHRRCNLAERNRRVNPVLNRRRQGMLTADSKRMTGMPAIRQSRAW
jgi:hypothetical protein